MCELAHGPAPTPEHEAAHSCGKGAAGCLTLRHLRWATAPENQADKIAHGTAPRGEHNPSSKLTEDDVRFIRAHHRKLRNLDMAERFGVNKEHISNIVRRKTWAWLPD
jgi:hypothetical protein